MWYLIVSIPDLCPFSYFVYFRPPPRQCEEEVPALEHKVEVSESPATEVIPVDEQAELDKINKLLNKAQGARNAHKKMVNIFSLY